MSLLTRRLDPRRPRPRRPLPGDAGRPLTRSSGPGRALRLVITVLLLLWFLLPILPLGLWSAAGRWPTGSALPTSWGTVGLDEATRVGAVAALGRSFALALGVAMIATPLGALTARALVRGWAPFPRLVTALVFAPVLLPPFAAVLGVTVILLRVGIPATAGVLLILVVAALPYTTFTMRVAYAGHDIGYEEEARMLGASRIAVLHRVHLPLMAPALARAAFLAFLVGWSDYLVTVIVGGGQLLTLPVLVASFAAGVGNDSLVAVLSLAAVIPPLMLLLGLGAGRDRGRAPAAGRASTPDRVPGPVSP